jgi:hypothetical protein
MQWFNKWQITLIITLLLLCRLPASRCLDRPSVLGMPVLLELGDITRVTAGLPPHVVWCAACRRACDAGIQEGVFAPCLVCIVKAITRALCLLKGVNMHICAAMFVICLFVTEIRHDYALLHVCQLGCRELAQRWPALWKNSW